MTDSAIGGVPTSGTDVAGDDHRTTPDAGVESLDDLARAAADVPNGTATDGAPVDGGSSELDRLQADLAERTADVQRVSAEYANYRRRVDRDRESTVTGAKAQVASELLTVLDDIARAEQHGDLTGPFKGVADRLRESLERVGLEAFTVEGDPFDPAVHEAVAQETSAEVSGPTVTTVMRRGYRFGERVLRPAMVAVTDRDPDAGPALTADLPEAEAAGNPGAINPDAT